MNRIFYLLLLLSLILPSALLAEQQGWGKDGAKDDLEQIDEPEAQDADEPPPAEPAKRAPAENPKAPVKNEVAAPLTDQEDMDENEEAEEANQPPTKWTPSKVVKLQGLNKVTARTVPVNTNIGEKVKFGNLEIQVEKCMRGPDSDKPDNTALMTIWDGIPGQPKKQVFHGWMFSSSPALSALEHPIYDVVLLSCADK